MKTKNFSLFVLSLIILISITAGCKKKSSDPETVYYYANAQVKGVNYTFKTTSSFSKFCILTGVCNTFFVDPMVTNKNLLMIGLPVTVKAGITYTSDSSHTQVMFTDPTGRQYFSTYGDSLNISITKWEGHGGTGAGTFSGKLRYQGPKSFTPDSVYIKNGSFSSRIWFTIQK
jgi:hypothetical protein